MLVETLFVVSIEIPPPESVVPASPYLCEWWNERENEPVFSDAEEDFRRLLDIMLMERLEKFGD